MGADGSSGIRVEVAYARADLQCVLPVAAGADASVQQIIVRSGILERFTEIDLAVNRVGIFGRIVDLTEPARDGDRIEIYRPLAVDPREQRRRRAAEQARRS